MFGFIHRRLAVKLTIGYGVAVVGVAAAVGFFLTHQLEARALQQLESSLVTQARLMAYALPTPEIDLKERPPLQILAREMAGRGNCRVTLVAADGTVVADSDVPLERLASVENHRDRPEIQAALQGRVGCSTRQSATVRRGLFYVAVPVQKEGSVTGVVRVALPVTQVHELVMSVAGTLSAGLGLTVALIIGVSGWLARRMTRPLRAIADSAYRISRGELTARASVASQDEVGQLARAFNSMAQELQGKIREMETNRSQIEGILQGMIEGVLAVGPNGEILLINTAARNILGIRPDVPTGIRAKDLIRQPELQELIRPAGAMGQPRVHDLTLYAPSERALRVHATSCQAPTGRGSLLVFHDITDLKRLETLRRDFVANVSHELKTPLTAIQGAVETLLGGALKDADRGKPFVESIAEEAGRLRRLVDDLLALAQVESKQEELRPETLSLQAFLEKEAARHQPAARSRAVSLNLEPVSPGLALPADREHLAQAVGNLLDNAIQYNRPGGRVTLRASSDSGTCRIEVEDTGIGIPPEDLPRIFERFYRVDKGRSRETGGTGLGLSIVKHVAEAHNGSVEVESRSGSGSRFTLIFPLQ